MLLHSFPAEIPPHLLYRRLERRFGNTFLLESAEGPERLARYSLMGFNPRGLVAIKQGHIQVIGDLPLPDASDSPADYLRLVLRDTVDRHEKPTPEDFQVPWNGGLVGYFGYDYVRYVEGLPDTQDDDEGWPDAQFGLYLDGLILDHRARTLHYFSHDDDRSEAVLAAMEATPRPSRPLEVGELVPNMTQEEFEAGVRTIQHHIREGDVFQAVLSKRLSAEYRGDVTAFYEALRTTNPSPYMYQLTLGERHLIGASPEMLIRVETDAWRYRDGGRPDQEGPLTDGGATIETFPIAGTRPIGATEAETRAYAEELLADPKENAEHEMLVDLARNDVGRVADYGTVRVPDHRTVERYSHVQHIVSRVRARLAHGMDALDALAAVFPAGTVSGAPKVRAMELLERLEPTRRGPYAGAVGYLALNGNMDTAITIRTLTATHRRVSVQSGAGIVADSDPTREWNETEQKARALVHALGKERAVVQEARR
ncbi:MAG: anthranilate synthase component I family protein [Euryarchaeota archaeon]|nr:anthranilate synthase component I family protein [Euryarchaeota archaeon]